MTPLPHTTTYFTSGWTRCIQPTMHTCLIQRLLLVPWARPASLAHLYHRLATLSSVFVHDACPPVRRIIGTYDAPDRRTCIMHEYRGKGGKTMVEVCQRGRASPGNQQQSLN